MLYPCFIHLYTYCNPHQSGQFSLKYLYMS